MELVPYDLKYEKELQKLSEYTQAGDIHFIFSRRPNFLSGAFIQTKDPELYLLVANKKVIGCVNIGKRDYWYLGEKKSLRYFCDLKIHPKYQNGTAFIYYVKLMSTKIFEEGLPVQMIMFKENKRIINIVSGRKNKRKSLHIFHGHKIGEVRTCLIERNNKIKADGNCSVTKATEADKIELQSFIDVESEKIDFFPVYILNNINDKHYKDLQIHDFYLARKKGKIVACFALWDLSKVKQIYVVDYSKKFKIIKPFYNLYASIVGRNKLKNKGDEVRNLYVSCLLVKDRDGEIYKEMLSKVLMEKRNESYDYLLSTLDERDPLSEVHRSIRNKREIEGEFYVGYHKVEREKFTSGAYFYVEAARI